MNIGKITQAISEFGQKAADAVTKHIAKTDCEQIQEISSESSKATRALGLSKVIFKKADSSEGILKQNLKRLLEDLKEKNYENPLEIVKSLFKLITKDNLELANEMLGGGTNHAHISSILKNVQDKESIEEYTRLVRKINTSENLSKNLDKNELKYTIMQELCWYKDTKSEQFQKIKKLIELWLDNPKVSSEYRFNQYFREIIALKENPETIEEMLGMITQVYEEPRLIGNKNLKFNISGLISQRSEKAIKAKKAIIQEFLNNPEFEEQSKDNIGVILETINEHNGDIISTILKLINMPEHGSVRYNFYTIMRNCMREKNAKTMSGVLKKLTTEQRYLEDESMQRKMGYILARVSNSQDAKFIEEFFKLCDARPALKDANMGTVISEFNGKNFGFIRKYVNNQELYGNKSIRENIGSILKNIQKDKDTNGIIMPIFEQFKKTQDLGEVNIGEILANVNEKNFGFIQGFLSSKTLRSSEEFKSKLIKILELSDKNADIEPLEEFVLKTPPEKLAKLSSEDIINLSNLVSIENLKDLNEIPLAKKKSLLDFIISKNISVFKISEKYGDNYPILPKTKDEYCALLNRLVKSIGIQTKPLTRQQINIFNGRMFELSDFLAKISDKEFAGLEITQSYTKESFIKDILEKVKGLDEKELQKVYDYFGFEIKTVPNSGGKLGLVGYPVNLNNGEKLAQIKNPKTKDVINSIRENVILFSENNKIIASNPLIQEYLNELLRLAPELRTTINKAQHGTHDYDIIKHSLKVMSKVAQNPSYKQLSESDKKVMLLSSLYHDITKAEGKISPLHPQESAFDTFYIAKKFNLTRSEEVKLYTLIKHHEWLGDINKTTDEAARRAKIQSYAYDMQADNTFELAKILTEADLKGIKKDDSFYEYFKDDFARISKEVDKSIQQLRKTQPLLPTTKLPKADIISRAITKVNPDMSTNIKGLYKTPEGLIVIKFNEIEDWEALGFPKGTISKGIRTISESDKTPIDTGNIKFIVHGLDTETQLATFDALGLPDSDALLSVSYTERPESKYRFFRPQGIIVETDTNYIHGGGNTDKGSGYKKTIQTFKDQYIFGAKRQSDREYVSKLIKQALDMNDEEYLAFVNKYKNKSMLEIEPEEVREKLIKAMAQINSSTRLGNRNYNEMYISNPKITGIFAYSEDDKVGKVSDFMGKQEDFLKKYALENNMPFIIFGD
ncbi:MAG: HD domain-containing protein [Candidatus Gastranaerophilales bacterium]|nr:HD domain-containing protein [Candidatus Gastranaerophilales bacterium]